MIPDWNASGLLPPIRPEAAGHSADRSPYVVSLHQVMDRFATSSERIAILHGLLDYRQELYQHGILHGFQWLDGNFMEQTEVLESRFPNDVDVVTFFHLPDGMDQTSLVSTLGYLFTPAQTKARFHVDGYPFILGQPTAAHHIRQIAYWYSMWAHRRNGVWKGFLQVDLDPQEDEAARQALESFRQEGYQS